MAVDANGKWINPNDTKVVAFDIWDGVGEANKSFLVPKPTTWLAKIAADLRAAFSQFSKFSTIGICV